MRGGPGILVAEGDRHHAGGLELLAGLEELGIGLRLGDAVGGEDLLVVEHELGVDVDRHAIELALVLEGAHRGFGEAVLPVAVIDRRRDVEGAAAARELLAELARPREEHVGHLVRGHQHADLVLVGLVGDGLHLDLDVGMRGLELRHGLGEVGHVLGLRPFVQEGHGDLGQGRRRHRRQRDGRGQQDG